MYGSDLARSLCAAHERYSSGRDWHPLSSLRHQPRPAKIGQPESADTCSPQGYGVETVHGDVLMFKRYKIPIALAALILVLGGLLLFSDPTISGIGFKYKNF
jgi:hypothetical protein